MARHRGAHRDETGYRRRTVAQVSAVLLLAVVGWAVIRMATAQQAACSGEVRLSVAAAPEIAPAIQATGAHWAAGVVTDSGECVTLDVFAAAAASVAAALARQAGVALPGVAIPAATMPVPEVWIPDSSSWLERLRVVAPATVPDTAQPVASSPVVVAVPEPVARTLGWPQTQVTWAGLLPRLSGPAPLTIGIADPTRNASGLSGLLAMEQAAQAGEDAKAVTVAAMRALIQGRSGAEADLIAKFPDSASADALAAGLAAAPLPEQALVAYNAGHPAVPLAALYPTPAPPALDYPYAVLPGADDEHRALAHDLLRALSGTAYHGRLATAWLRAPDGVASFSMPPGAPALVPPAAPPAEAVTRAVASWISVTKPARMLAVLDISGSMLTPVPAAGGRSRGEISLAAARQGLLLMDDAWSVGLWTFATKLDGAKDYRQLVPIAPLSTNRDALAKALGSVVVPPQGLETGLYDTVLAAYQTVQRDWDPAAVNSVVILTDGTNKDPDGISLAELVAKLTAAKDEARPIQVIAIGIGDQVSETELRTIVDATGGGVFLARDPSAIGEIFLEAIALRPGLSP